MLLCVCLTWVFSELSKGFSVLFWLSGFLLNCFHFCSLEDKTQQESSDFPHLAVTHASVSLRLDYHTLLRLPELGHVFNFQPSPFHQTHPSITIGVATPRVPAVDVLESFCFPQAWQEATPTCNILRGELTSSQSHCQVSAGSNAVVCPQNPVLRMKETNRSWLAPLWQRCRVGLKLQTLWELAGC